jgi:TRAP-type C4-dicarboxylate transport system permease small subunit
VSKARFALRASEQFIGVCAALVLFCLMGLGVVDVVFRYLLNSPVPGAAEIAELLLGVMVFLALPLATARREHVTVDLLPVSSQRLRGRLRLALTYLISAGVAAAMAWQLAGKARDQADYGDTSAFLSIPLAPIAWLMTTTTAIAAAILLAQALLTLAGRIEAKAEAAP